MLLKNCPYVNSHTHYRSDSNEILDIINLSLNENPINHFYTAGIHPREIENYDLEEVEQKLIPHIENPYFLALGEFGLDRSIEVPIEKQISFFIKQIEMAKKYQIETVVIHCVRAFSDLFNLLDKSPFSGNVIIHDFNGNKEIIEACLKRDYFFGLGSTLFRKNSKTTQNLSLIPDVKILFETDDHTGRTIKDVYQAYASIQEICKDRLKERVLKNSYGVFGNLDAGSRLS